jgi:hypothetical protein
MVKACNLAADALEATVNIIQLYAAHKDERCSDEAVKCECGLQTMKIIGEARLLEFKEKIGELNI